VETPGYLADAKDAGLTDAEREKIVATVSRYPTAGDEIPGTDGAGKSALPRAARARAAAIAWSHSSPALTCVPDGHLCER
jgi:hypothetical protein